MSDKCPMGLDVGNWVQLIVILAHISIPSDVHGSKGPEVTACWSFCLFNNSESTRFPVRLGPTVRSELNVSCSNEDEDQRSMSMLGRTCQRHKLAHFERFISFPYVETFTFPRIHRLCRYLVTQILTFHKLCDAFHGGMGPIKVSVDRVNTGSMSEHHHWIETFRGDDETVGGPTCRFTTSSIRVRGATAHKSQISSSMSR